MISITNADLRTQWNAYVARNDQSSCAHLYEWTEAIAGTYNLQTFHLLAENDVSKKTVGILPLILFSPPASDKRLISLPYSDCAGILADDIETSGKLLSAAWQFAKNNGARHLELRQPQARVLPVHETISNNNQLVHSPFSFKVGLSRALPGSVEELWREIGPKVRNQIRKAEKCGYTSRIGGAEEINRFYTVFSENMRDLGSPVHDRNLFEQLAKQLSEKIRVFIVERNGYAAAASLAFLHNGTLFNPWASSLRRLRPECPNMLLYWSMLRYGVQQDCRSFDFGRSSPGAPTCRFKLQWGAEMQPLIWHVLSQHPHTWSPKNESLENSDWKKLDLETSRRRGPAVRRWISL